MSLRARPSPAFRLRHPRKRLRDLFQQAVNDGFSGRSPPHGLGHRDPDRRAVGPAQLEFVSLEGDALVGALRKVAGQRCQVHALGLLHGGQAEQAEEGFVRLEQAPVSGQLEDADSETIQQRVQARFEANGALPGLGAFQG